MKNADIAEMYFRKNQAYPHAVTLMVITFKAHCGYCGYQTQKNYPPIVNKKYTFFLFLYFICLLFPYTRDLFEFNIRNIRKHNNNIIKSTKNIYIKRGYTPRIYTF